MKNFNIYSTNNKAVKDAYEMLMAGIINDTKKSLKTISIISCKPEEGKTSLAINLSLSIARSGWRVLLIDADMRKPTEAKRLNKGSQSGLSDFLSGKAEFSDIVEHTNIENMTYISCGTAYQGSIELLCGARFLKLAERVRNDYDYVIFDTPAMESVFDAAIIASKVDAALIVVRMGSTKLASLKRTKEQLDNLNVMLLGIVLNKVQKRDYKKYYSNYNYFYNTKKFFKISKKKSVSIRKRTSGNFTESQ